MSAYLFGLMYQVFIIPLFDYCDVMWIPCLAKQVKAMERIHSKVSMQLFQQDQNVYIKGFKSCSYPSKTEMFIPKVLNLAVQQDLNVK